MNKNLFSLSEEKRLAFEKEKAILEGDLLTGEKQFCFQFEVIVDILPN